MLDHLQEKYETQPLNTEDGLRIEFDDEWVHLRKSNTEAIIRIYAESQNATTADTLAKKIMEDIRNFMKEVA